MTDLIGTKALARQIAGGGDTTLLERRLWNWTNRDIIKAVEKSPGTGRARLYGKQAQRRAALAEELYQLGLDSTAIARVLGAPGEEAAGVDKVYRAALRLNLTFFDYVFRGGRAPRGRR